MEDIIKTYEKILQLTKQIKQSIMLELSNDLLFSMELPTEIVAELDILATIDGQVIGALSDKGLEVSNVPGKEGYKSISIDDVTYITHESKLPGTKKINSFPKKSDEKMINDNSSDAITKDTLPTSHEEEVIKEEIKKEIKEEIKEEIIPEKIEESETSTTFTSEEYIAKNNNSNTQSEILFEDDLPDFLDGFSDNKENDNKENNNEETPFEADDENIKEIDFSQSTTSNEEERESAIINDDVTAEESTEENNTTNVTPLKATVIGGDFQNTPVVAPMARADVFAEEKRKASSELVFDSYRMSICHIGSRMEEMQFMIAPLKIQKYSCPSVPIIVSVYYKGRIYTASSFDKNEDGRNMVTIDINEYYFICRGFFNDNGEFQSSIVTTGISANQGDVMNIISHKSYKPTGSMVKNGHPKFRYNGEDGAGIIEVFPLEMNGNDFVIMTRCGEFVDYIPISNAAHGLNRALIFDSGVKSEVICTWDGDYLETDIVPV